MSISEIDERAFEAYCKYVALKNHFTLDSYDYLRYNGKIAATKEMIITRQDKMIFLKLANISFPLEDFLISNFIKDENFWLDSLLDKKIGEVNYKEWKFKIDRITNHVKSQLAKCEIYTYKELKQLFFVTKTSKIPKIISLYKEDEISLETMTILYHILNVGPYWKEKLKEKFLSPKIHKRIIKYEHLLVKRIDIKKIENLIVLMDTED